MLAACAYLDGNFQTVETGRLYRSGQLSPEGLERQLEKHSIRTVVSLRASEPKAKWYRAESELCDAEDVLRIDIPWSMKKLPTPESLLKLLDVYDAASDPVLVHCQGGTHRAGVASAVYLLHRGRSPDEARMQFGRFFDDAPIGELIDLYDGSPKSFRRWAEEDYPKVFAKRNTRP